MRGETEFGDYAAKLTEMLYTAISQCRERTGSEMPGVHSALHDIVSIIEATQVQHDGKGISNPLEELHLRLKSYNPRKSKVVSEEATERSYKITDKILEILLEHVFDGKLPEERDITQYT